MTDTPRCCPTCTCSPSILDSGSLQTRSLAEFNRVFGAYVSAWPTSNIPPDVKALRLKLLKEEYDELVEAIESDNVLHIAKESADLNYVVQGAADAYGIDLDAVFRAVHESNMTKVAPDGTVHRRADGKILKPDTYREADVARALGLTKETLA